MLIQCELTRYIKHPHVYLVQININSHLGIVPLPVYWTCTINVLFKSGYVPGNVYTCTLSTLIFKLHIILTLNKNAPLQQLTKK